MFALAAAIIWVIVALGGHLGSVNLHYLALAALALHFAFAMPVWRLTAPWRRGR